MPVFRSLSLCCLLALNASSIADPAGNTRFPAISVKDSHGKPLAGAEAAVRKENHVANFIDGWYKADADGLIQINIDRAMGHWENAIAEGKYRVMIRHKGFAPSTLMVDIPTTQSEIAAVLQPGQVIEFQVQPYGDTQLPAELKPVVVDTRVSTTTQRSFFPESEYNQLGEPLSLFDVERTGANTFESRVPRDLDFPLQFVINDPEYLRNYVSPEFSPAEILKGQVAVELPIPGTIKVAIQPKETTAPTTFPITQVTAGFWKDDVLALTTTGSKSINSEIKGVVPGDYNLSIKGAIAAATDVLKQFPSYAKPELFVYPEEVVKVEPGKQVLVKQEYPLLPRDYFDGDGSVTLEFASASGRSVAGMPYRILAHLDNYMFIPVRQGTISDDSTIRATGLRRDGIRYYDLQVGKASSSIFVFRDDTVVTGTRYIAPAEGDAAPELVAWDVETSEKLSLASLKGKMVVLEFWATWCGPCQPSMQKLSDISKTLPADLRDEVEFLTISVDDGVDEVKKRLKEKGWANGKVRHYWYGPGSPSARGGPYGVTSIPHAVIIDKDGKIAVENYSISDDLVEKLRALRN